MFLTQAINGPIARHICRAPCISARMVPAVPAAILSLTPRVYISTFLIGCDAPYNMERGFLWKQVMIILYKLRSKNKTKCRGNQAGIYCLVCSAPGVTAVMLKLITVISQNI